VRDGAAATTAARETESLSDLPGTAIEQARAADSPFASSLGSDAPSVRRRAVTAPVIAAEPPVKTYRLYLPGPFKIMVPAILGLFTLLGVAMVFGLFPDAQARPFGFLWLAVVGTFWYKVLTIPYQIDVVADGRATFVSLVRRVQVSPREIQSIKPQGNQLGFFVLKHSGGRLRLIGQFDGFHEFLSALKAANPGIELRGC
jgi:hypothetical protein